MINVVALAFGIWFGGAIIGWLVTYWVITEMRWAEAESRSLFAGTTSALQQTPGDPDELRAVSKRSAPCHFEQGLPGCLG